MEMPAWLERAAPATLGVFLGQTASRRKSGLFVRHLCRCYSEVFIDPRSLAALDAADRYEAGEIDEPAYRAAVQASVQAAEEAQTPVRAATDSQTAHGSAFAAAWSAHVAAHIAREIATRGYYKQVLPDLGRIVGPSNSRHSTPKKRTAGAMRRVFFEHFGDIQRPVALAPAWLAWNYGTIPTIARRIYDERSFHDMPLLADALEDAGCIDEAILNHCRQPGEHVRGCWIVDLILGRE